MVGVFSIFFVLSPKAWPSDLDVVISEIHYHPPQGEGDAEFIELYNCGEEPVDLSGWSFTEGIRFTFSQRLILQGKACLVVIKDSTADFKRYGISSSAGAFEGSLSNEGEVITLKSDIGRVIESFRYDDSSPWPEDSDGLGSSLERIDPLFDEEFPTSWRPGNPYSPGYASTPLQSVESDIIINEISYHPAIDSTSTEYVELFNRGDKPLPLGGWTLRGGIEFFFPASLVLQPNTFLVVAKSNKVRESFPQLESVSFAGVYRGSLSNSGERITLVTSSLTKADEVDYHDEGVWPEQADGKGATLELRNAWLDNSLPFSWTYSTNSGTPGEHNSSYEDNPDPVVVVLRHEPLVPRPFQPVTITVRATDEKKLKRLTLYHRTEQADQGAKLDSPITHNTTELFLSKGIYYYSLVKDNYTSVPMYDDGFHGDMKPNDGIFGAIIFSSFDDSITDFYVEALDSSDKRTSFPINAPASCCLFQVDSQIYPQQIPLYRLVLRFKDLNTLTERDPYDDTLLDCTFISNNSVYYSARIRYRGRTSRLEPQKSYRIDFPEGYAFDNVTELNLNGFRPEYQILAWDFVGRLGGLYPCDVQPVQLVLNNTFSPLLCRIESVDGNFLDQAFPGDNHGNLYRGDHKADLRYLGEDPSLYNYIEDGLSYGYLKKNNEDNPDYSDIIELTKGFTKTTTSTFPEIISDLIDVPQWIRYFAVNNVLGNREGGIYLDTGDDYFLYHRPSDSRFLIFPWDLDFTFQEPEMPIFRQSVPAIVRLIQSPDYVRFYYAELMEALKSAFSIRSMRKSISKYEQLLTAEIISEMHRFISERTVFLESNIPDRLTYDAAASGVAASDTQIDIPAGVSWRYFRGKSEPSDGTIAWTMPEYDDSNWENGPTGIGFGDGDDATILSDMEAHYFSVYLRHTFSVDDTSSLKELYLNVDWDDGFVAYLNGVEVARSYLGTIGSFVPFYEPASANHEAGTPISFDISAFLSLIRSGTNTVAVQCHNRSLDSTDLTIIPELYSYKKSKAPCGKTAFTTETVTLQGHANAAHTLGVMVQGTQASWNPLKAEWTADVHLSDGLNIISMNTDCDQPVFNEQRNLYFVKYTQGTRIEGGLSGNLHWSPENSPYIIRGWVSISKGSSLIIEPGTVVLLEPGARFDVRCPLIASGTPNSPIVFQSLECSPWDRIEILGSLATGLFEHCVFENSLAGGDGNQEYIGAVTLYGSNVVIRNCHFRNCHRCVVALYGAEFEIVTTTFEDTSECIYSAQCYALIDSCTFINVIGYADAIDFSGPVSPPPRITNNLFLGGGDDAIDEENTTLIIEGNIFTGFDFYDHKGISLEGPGSPLIRNNLFFGCDIGIAIKNHCTPTIDHNTIVDNRIAIHSYAKETGQGPGYGSLINSILWLNDKDIWLEHRSTLDVSYCDTFQEIQGMNNISSNPLFVFPEINDFSLKSTSPCIGKAEDGLDMGYVSNLPSTTPMPTHTRTPSPTTTPYSSQIPGDLNSDGQIDLFDLYFISTKWYQHINPEGLLQDEFVIDVFSSEELIILLQELNHKR